MRDWVLVTREAQDLGELTRWVPDHLELFPYPVLRLRPWEDSWGWSQVVEALPKLRVLVFTSRHAPEPFRLQAHGRGVLATLSNLPAAAVGETTAGACRAAGFRVEVVGETSGAALAEAISQRWDPPIGVLFPCGREHREELVTALEAKGFTVLPLAVYAMDAAAACDLPVLPAHRPRAVVLTSPRAAALYWHHTQGRFAGVPHIAWGPTTAQALLEFGVKPEILAKPNPQSLKEALCRIL